MADIKVSLATFLVADPGVNGAIAGRLYPDSAPQGSARPRIVMQGISLTRPVALAEVQTGARARVTLHCDAVTRNAANDLAVLVRDAVGPGSRKLNGFQGTMGSHWVQKALVEDEREQYTPSPHGHEVGNYRTSLDLVIVFDE
jgi:hypothetical protein